MHAFFLLFQAIGYTVIYTIIWNNIYISSKDVWCNTRKNSNFIILGVLLGHKKNQCFTLVEVEALFVWKYTYNTYASSIKSTCKLSVCISKNLRWLNEQVKRVKSTKEWHTTNFRRGIDAYISWHLRWSWHYSYKEVFCNRDASNDFKTDGKQKCQKQSPGGVL